MQLFLSDAEETLFYNFKIVFRFLQARSIGVRDLPQFEGADCFVPKC